MENNVEVNVDQLCTIWELTYIIYRIYNTSLRYPYSVYTYIYMYI